MNKIADSQLNVSQTQLGLTQLAHKASGIRVKSQGSRGATAPLRSADLNAACVFDRRSKWRSRIKVFWTFDL
ncbi:hypothetical protein [aff. Roholtiella sp. LEGE 12411]|uniref:hypothetical protein n=1 Tax=aff. Roholtiella sp. LEGE 12411 TaxID=1828822 RepID=UPI00187DE628|nr:hypothetical protein [aff. Roholtiella sp. LEGE 12411]MBE9034699.1 hypothetical protein [aff. Roholtiella sp. LEGE 12411]